MYVIIKEVNAFASESQTIVVRVFLWRVEKENRIILENCFSFIQTAGMLSP
jgi:hypothetical protein